MKRLYWDAETSPNIVLSFRVGKKIDIPYDNILLERKIICIGYKWAGQKLTHVLPWDENQDDGDLIRSFSSILAEADESVAHFGDSYDHPFLKGRAAHHGIQLFPSYKTIDTCAWASRKFRFNCNKLDYLGQFLGVGKKIETPRGLWKKVLIYKDPEALKTMMKYCAGDVRLLEKVYEKLSLLVPHKTHVGVMNGAPKWTCPRDGGEDVRISKTRVTAGGTKQFQLQCKTCGGYYSINEASANEYLSHMREQSNRREM
jgi:hypothetical protein